MSRVVKQHTKKASTFVPKTMPRATKTQLNSYLLDDHYIESLNNTFTYLIFINQINYLI